MTSIQAGCPIHYNNNQKEGSLASTVFVQPFCRSALICFAARRNLEQLEKLNSQKSQCVMSEKGNLKKNLIVMVNENTQTVEDHFKDANVSEDSSESEYLDICRNYENVFCSPVKRQTYSLPETEHLINAELFGGEAQASGESISHISTDILFVCSACANKSTHSVKTSVKGPGSSIQCLTSNEKLTKNLVFEEIPECCSTQPIEKNTSEALRVDSKQVESPDFVHLDVIPNESEERLEDVEGNFQHTSILNGADTTSTNENNENFVFEINDKTVNLCVCSGEDHGQDSLTAKNSTTKQNQLCWPNLQYNFPENVEIEICSVDVLCTEKTEKPVNTDVVNEFQENLKKIDEGFKASHRLERLEERTKVRGERIFNSLQSSPTKRKQSVPSIITRVRSCSDIQLEKESFPTPINEKAKITRKTVLNSANSCPALFNFKECTTGNSNLKDNDFQHVNALSCIKNNRLEDQLESQVSELDFQSEDSKQTSCTENVTNTSPDKKHSVLYEENFQSNVFQVKTTSSPEQEDFEICKIFKDDKHEFSDCEFDVNLLDQHSICLGENKELECYDELFEELETSIVEDNLHEDLNTCAGEDYCYCSIEAVPLYHTISSNMRETNGTLRGLLKKPNRPPSVRKNRVVFDETRNQFFEADYIILIREDCPYDEEDEEPCTCGEHELVRICCDDSCNCTFTEDGRTPPSPKFAPPIEFVDQATLSPPDGYKDAGGNLIDSALQGALGGHVFGAQHIQQLQVIQRLQQQRAAMLAARAAAQTEQHQNLQSNVCTECAECAECAAKQLQEECDSQCSDESPSDIPAIPITAIVPLRKASPEKRIIQKEIVAGEERPKFISPKQSFDNEKSGMENIRSTVPSQSYVVETITMTTITERRVVHEATDAKDVEVTEEVAEKGASLSSLEKNMHLIHKSLEDQLKHSGLSQSINGILKGGKLWKDQNQCDDSTNTTSDEETSSKRSVRFSEETKARETGEGESESGSDQRQPIDYVSHSIKRHSSLFHNALRPNSALRQLFPNATQPAQQLSPLTNEQTNAQEESKMCQEDASAVDSETESIKKTIERNVFRRSFIKYEPRKQKQAKDMTSLEERIRQLTCDLDEPLSEQEQNEIFSKDSNDNPLENFERRNSPAGEEFSNQTKPPPHEKHSASSTYKKITDLFNRDKKQEKSNESSNMNIQSIVPQDCRCPAGPDIGIGVQIQGGHTQVHQPPPPPPRHPDTKRQFLSTLVPLTACVAGQRDDFSYYTLAQPGSRASITSSHCTEYSVSDIDKALAVDEETKKVAPDVIVGTPGQETDELAVFVEQEANRTESVLKKRIGSDNNSDLMMSDEDDEQNDYGFNKRPHVKGIKAKISTNNDVLKELQDQLSQNLTTHQVPATIKTQTAQTQIVHSSTLPRPHSSSAMHIAAKQVRAHHQHTSSWSYYPDQGNAQVDPHGNYYQLPSQGRHSYHGQDMVYQNSNTVAVQQIITPQQQYVQRYVRSPTRRPESPPPLRNFHQTMVLIPYNSNPYPQYNTEVADSTLNRKHNVVEYQQVTQQTIRVPFGYHLPGMQLHLVAGRGTAQHFSTLPRIGSPNNMAFQASSEQQPNVSKFAERGAPEGAASSQANDVTLSPTNSQNSLQASTNASQSNAVNAKNISSAQATNAVYYAMNI